MMPPDGPERTSDTGCSLARDDVATLLLLEQHQHLPDAVRLAVALEVSHVVAHDGWVRNGMTVVDMALVLAPPREDRGRERSAFWARPPNDLGRPLLVLRVHEGEEVRDRDRPDLAAVAERFWCSLARGLRRAESTLSVLQHALTDFISATWNQRGFGFTQEIEVIRANRPLHVEHVTKPSVMNRATGAPHAR